MSLPRKAARLAALTGPAIALLRVLGMAAAVAAKILELVRAIRG